MTHSINDLTGTWRVVHWYPARDDASEESSEHEMRAIQKGSELVFEAVTGQDESYMFIRLKIDGNIAAGSWHEATKPDGAYKGMEYSGAGQLVVSPDGQRMEGMWAGAGVDRKAGNPRIYTGRWEFDRIG